MARRDGYDYGLADDPETKGPDLPALAGRAWQVANGIVDKVVDVACDITPANIDRSTVSLAVKAGLVLVAFGFLQSVVGFLFSLGTGLLVVFLASKMLGNNGSDSKKAGKWESDRW